jgi:hypothetical protein
VRRREHHSFAAEHIDRNSGTVFSLWDRTFGTCYHGEEEYPEVGVTDPRFPLEPQAVSLRQPDGAGARVVDRGVALARPTIRVVTNRALTCPHCGARLTIADGRCRYCNEPVPVAAGMPPPPPGTSMASAGGGFSMLVEDVFAIKKRGTVVTGRVEGGPVRVGDRLVIDGPSGELSTEVTGIEVFRQTLDEAHEGQTVGLLLRGVDRDQVSAGSRIRTV